MISFGAFLLENLALGSCSLETCQEGGFSEKVGACWLQSYTGSYFRYWTVPHAKYREQSYVWDTAVFITVGRSLILMMITVFPCEFLLFQMSQFGQGSFCSALLLGTEMSPRCISGGRGQRVGAALMPLSLLQALLRCPWNFSSFLRKLRHNRVTCWRLLSSPQQGVEV